jgi:hypothetical protein
MRHASAGRFGFCGTGERHQITTQIRCGAQQAVIC